MFGNKLRAERSSIFKEIAFFTLQLGIKRKQGLSAPERAVKNSAGGLEIFQSHRNRDSKRISAESFEAEQVQYTHILNAGTPTCRRFSEGPSLMKGQQLTCLATVRPLARWNRTIDAESIKAMALDCCCLWWMLMSPRCLSYRYFKNKEVALTVDDCVGIMKVF